MEANLDVVRSGSYIGIRQIIDEYIEKMQGLIYEKYTMRDSLTTWLGVGKIQKAPYHEQLYKDVEQEVDNLVKQLDMVADEMMAERAVRTILTYGRDDFGKLEDSIRLTLVAVEALAIPLLGYMDPEDVKALRDEYLSRYPKKEMLPRQKELYRRMCELCGEKRLGQKSGLGLLRSLG